MEKYIEPTTKIGMFTFSPVLQITSIDKGETEVPGESALGKEGSSLWDDIWNTDEE